MPDLCEICGAEMQPGCPNGHFDGEPRPKVSDKYFEGLSPDFMRGYRRAIDVAIEFSKTTKVQVDGGEIDHAIGLGIGLLEKQLEDHKIQINTYGQDRTQ